MFDTIAEGISFLQAQSLLGLLTLFWFVIIFEIPRYMLSFLPAALLYRVRNISSSSAHKAGKISVVIAGHNEEKSIEACVRSLWEQSLKPDEIVVVSDGSTDKMLETLSRMLKQKLIHRVHGTELRAGKSAATNLAERLSSGDIIVNVDCDCSFGRQALKEIVAPFLDKEVGAVSGNIYVRNARKSLVTTFQAIEYLISISLGKRSLDLMGQVTCASGAFSAFRRTALVGVGGLDAGGGEDLDVTLRLRRAGWKIRFATNAICYTDAPDSLTALTKQRFRWERDAVRLRYRKHVGFINPFSPLFRPKELFHEFEFLLFNVIGAIALPVYIVWLFVSFGEFALAILIGTQIALTMLDFIVFLLAASANPKAQTGRLIPFVLIYSFFNGVLMRFLRLTAYLQEWLFDASYKDSYVPTKVHMERV